MDNPKSLVSSEWELIDPTPDIHALFIHFNDQFFGGSLSSVEVKWSQRMTLCAGLCRYEKRAGFCSISLSCPLLKLRPRKDLVETLLHEMIHAYLFVTQNNRDREGHGPEFQKHMMRINSATGTNITIYHSFHAEVKLYKQHWWRCSGTCTTRPPFYGFVKRSMNRAPGPNDNWWEQHKAICSGAFVKVKEPEGYGKKNTKQKKVSPSVASVKAADIRKFLSPVKGDQGPKQSGSTNNPGFKPTATKSGANGKVTGPSSGSSRGKTPNQPDPSSAPKRQPMFGNGVRTKSNGTTLTIQDTKTKAKAKTEKDVKNTGKTSQDATASQDSSTSAFTGKGNVLGGGSGVSRLLSLFSNIDTSSSAKSCSNDSGANKFITVKTEEPTAEKSSKGGERNSAVGSSDKTARPKASEKSGAATFPQERTFSSSSRKSNDTGASKIIAVKIGEPTTEKAYKGSERHLSVDSSGKKAHSEGGEKIGATASGSNDNVNRKRIFTIDSDSDGDDDIKPAKRIGNEPSIPSTSTSQVNSRNRSSRGDCFFSSGSSKPITVKTEEPSTSREIKINSGSDSESPRGVGYFPCPVCAELVPKHLINDHIDSCVTGDVSVKSEPVIVEDLVENDEWGVTQEVRLEGTYYPCPICAEQVLASEMNVHLDKCASGET